MKPPPSIATVICFGISGLVAAVASPSDNNARQHYNTGTTEMKAGKLREAESALRKAAETNEEQVLPPALYNLGHVRFLQGKETLKGEGSRQQLLDNAKAATVLAEEALKQGGEALQQDEVQEYIQAYQQGRGARKQLRLSNDELGRTLKLYASVVERWRRSIGDFQSSNELVSQNTDALFNAEIVERHLEKLLKIQKQLEMQAEGVGKKREELKKMMAELKGKIPKEMQRQSDDEEEDEDEEDGKDPKAGQPQEQRLGNEGEITPEMADWLKETMKQRKMSVDEAGEPKQRKNRKGRDW